MNYWATKWVWGVELSALPLDCLVHWSVLFTWRHNSMTTINNGAIRHDHSQIGLKALSTCHVVMLKSWQIVGLHEVIHQSSCTCHAPAKHLASGHNWIFQNKLIFQYLAVSMWSLWACTNICWSALKVIRWTCFCVNKPLQLHLLSNFDLLTSELGYSIRQISQLITSLV